MNVKCFFCSMVFYCKKCYYCKILKVCFWVYCGDVMVSDGMGGLISMVFFRSPPSKKHIGKPFSHITKCHLLQKVFKLQVLWSSHQFIKQG